VTYAQLRSGTIEIEGKRCPPGRSPRSGRAPIATELKRWITEHRFTLAPPLQPLPATGVAGRQTARDPHRGGDLTMARKRLDLTFPPRQATKAITYHLVKDFDLVPNILARADPAGQEGRMLLELTGPREAFEAGIAFLRGRGHRRLERPRATSASTRTRCVVCGLCTAVCRRGRSA
jgi:L-aspartate semialdehyde sulfurtransferase ferredoxin